MLGPSAFVFYGQYRLCKWMVYRLLLINLTSLLGLIKAQQSLGSTPPEDDLPQEISLDEVPAEAPPADSISQKKIDSKKPKNQKKSGKSQVNSPKEQAESKLTFESGESNDIQDSPDQWESFRDGGISPPADDGSLGIKIEDIVEPPSEYHYAAFGKPDPFKPVKRGSKKINELLDDPIESVEVPILSTLQLVNLDSVMVLGIWQGTDGKRKAMVTSQAPEVKNQSFVVKAGDPIGNRGGVIQSIESNHIKVNEFELLKDGTRQVNKKELPFYLSIALPAENFGSWIFNPGVPDPIQKTPPSPNGLGNAGNAESFPGQSAEKDALSPAGIPQSMLQSSGAGGVRQETNQFLGTGAGMAAPQGTPLPGRAWTPQAMPSAPPKAPASAYNPNAGKPESSPPASNQSPQGGNNQPAPTKAVNTIKAF